MKEDSGIHNVLTRTEAARFWRRGLGLRALQAMLVFLFAAIVDAPHLPENGFVFASSAVSTATQPIHSAAFLKKDSSGAIFSAERRHGSKIRWNDPLDALVPHSFAWPFQSYAAAVSATERFGQAADCCTAFQARAPPSLTV